MMQNFVMDFVFVQAIDQLRWYFHNRLRQKLSLSSAISTSYAQQVGNQKPQMRSTSGRQEIEDVIFGHENQADTAAKLAARERVMYGYMRSLRK
jgi:hypothetical protein